MKDTHTKPLTDTELFQIASVHWGYDFNTMVQRLVAEVIRLRAELAGVAVGSE